MTMKRGIKGHENMTHAGAFFLLSLELHELTWVWTTARNSGCFEGEEGEPAPYVFVPFSQEKVQER